MTKVGVRPKRDVAVIFEDGAVAFSPGNAVLFWKGQVRLLDRQRKCHCESLVQVKRFIIVWINVNALFFCVVEVLL